jgi:hypothetical protein
MNTIKQMLILIALIFSSTMIAQISPADMVEKIYIQTDKPMYVPGDNIWYNLTVYNGQNLPALLSDQVHIQLKKPDGSNLYEKKYSLTNGQVSDAIPLIADTPGGLYKFIATTGWMTECDPTYIYEKEIYIQKYISPRILMNIELDKESYGLGEEVVATFTTKDLKDNALSDLEVQYALHANGRELTRLYAQTDDHGQAILKAQVPDDIEGRSLSISAKITHKSQIESIRKTVPVILDDIDIQFLAEGGFLIEGYENTLAFKALAPNGKPVDVEGDIIDSNGNRVGGFVSLHDGMGETSIIPEESEQYFARLCKPYKSDQLIPIVNIASVGSKIEIESITNDILEVRMMGSLDQNLSLELSDVSVVKWNTDNVKRSNMIRIKQLPRGIYRLSLKNSDQTISERLVFLHPDRKLNIDVISDKKSYGLRDNVTAKIKTTDSNGLPVSSQVCVAVVEDKMLSHADDKEAHLVSELLLSSELSGDIHEPNYYFDSLNMKSIAALDLLMLTHGWRSHFDSLNLETAHRYYRSANTYVGQLINHKKNNNVGGVEVFVIDYSDRSAYIILTDEDGYFSVIREDGKNLTISANVSNREFYFKEVNLNTLKNRSPVKYRKLEEKIEKRGMIGKIVVDEPKKTKPVKVSLDEGVLMDEVQIVQYKIPLIQMDNTTSGSTVTAESIRSLPTKSINAIAATTAGIASTDEGAISIRGSRSASTVYYVDGVRVHGLLPQSAFRHEYEKEFDEEISLDFPNYRNNNKTNFNRIIYSRVSAKRKSLPRNIAFYVPKYGQEKIDKRNDFRQTLYWNPIVQTDINGEAEVSFSTSDEVTSFSVVVEGISSYGEIGRGKGKVIASKPLNIDCKIPSYFVLGDTSVLRIVVTNDSDKDQEITAQVGSTGSLALEVIDAAVQKIEAQSSHVFYARAIATGDIDGHMDIKISTDDDSDYLSRDYDILSPYFPLCYTASGVDSDTFSCTLSEPIASSIQVDFKTYNPISGALSGIESMLRRPGGCFEQVSSSTYPNVMVLQYLQNQNNIDSEIKEKALVYIKDGYKRLVDYETKVDGFDWWGRAPGHVALSAYGLLEFSDMMEVYSKVDKRMIKRTIDYLVKNRDGKGGFTMGKGYDGFGSAIYEVQTAYVLYALSEQSIKKVSLEKEYNKAKKNALKTKDMYLCGLLAMTAYNNGLNDDYRNFMHIIMNAMDVKDLNSIQSKNTITRSGQSDNNTETIAVCALAYMKSSNEDPSEVARLIDHISGKRKRGRFGSTQATCLAIKAILKYADWQGGKSTEGKILASLNGERISANSTDNDYGSLIDDGYISFSTDYAQPSQWSYSLDVRYESLIPPTASDHSLDLSVTLNQSTCELADIVGMDIVMKNKEQQSLANPTLVIGIPSGLSLDHKQLKEMKENETFDYFEIFENRLVIYYNEILAGDVKKMSLDLKADVLGKYTAPPSSAYLYYDEENIIWQKGDHIEVIYNEENFE